MSSIERIDDLAPIILKQSALPIIFKQLSQSDEHGLRKTFTGATQAVLDLMLENGLTLIPDRKAVWSSQIFYQKRCHFGFVEKAGTTFPDEPFGNRCKDLCQEKPARTTRHKGHISSHESRNPENGEWGGSAEFCFQLISLSGQYSLVVSSGACSGLKEWEDFALELGKYYHLRMIQREDEQVQEILRRVDRSVEHDPTGRPEGMKVSEYVKKVFDVIDTARVKA